jgi:DNA-binding CsgD family transcriptional regulator
MAGTPPPLRGRRPEVQLLRSRLAAASRDGRGAVVVLVGDPGSGKSRLLQQVRLLAGEVGARVLDVLGDPDEDVIPHGPVLHAVQAGPEPLLDRSALDRLPSGADQGWFLRQVLLSRLQEVAVRQPVVVCVDDLQWCGHGTLRLIRTLPALLSTDAVVWVVAVRSAMSDPAVASTVRVLTEAGADLVELGPLDSGAVAQLVGDVLGAVPDAGVLASAARAQGHPLLLVELLRGWLDERLVEVDGAGARLRGQVLPARLREAVERRTERLSPVARELLQIGAVLGRHFPPEVLAAMLDRPAPAVLSPLQEVVAAGLLETDGDRLRFTHDLIREAVVAGIPSAFCRELRRHAVDVLVARGAPTLQVATMLAESAVPGDLDAVSALREAAAGLAPTASPAAADFSLRALELLPEDSPLRPELVVETIKHLWQCGRAAAAEQLATATLTSAPGSDPEAEARVRLGLARFLQRYSSREAVRQCTTALALPDLPRGLTDDLLLLMAVNQGLAGEPDAADAVLVRAREAWGDAPAPPPESAYLRARAETYVAFHRQQWDRAFSRHQVVVEMHPAGDVMAPPAMWVATMWTSMGHPARSLAIIDAELAAARRDGRVGSLLMWSSFRARALFDAGRLEESHAEAYGVLEGEELDLVGGLMDLLVVPSLVRGALHSGRTDVARACRDRVERMGRDEAGQIRRNGLWLTALAADVAGDTEGALRAAAEAVATLDRPGPSMSGLPDLSDEVVLTRIALRGGQRQTAARAVEAAERRAAANPGYVVAAAVARHARGLLSGDEACLRDAVRLLQGTERPLLLASAREDLARAVAADRPREAIGLLDEALLAYGAAGAERDAARGRRRLRDLGIRRRRTLGPPGPREGLAGLTPTEREVARLVAEGRTNSQVATRMFVSPHTVNTHLRNAFGKLGVRSRVELARLVAAQDEPGRT